MADNPVRNALIGLGAAAIAGTVLWRLGVSGSNPSPSIEGPSTVYVPLQIAGLPSPPPQPFYLRGFADGGYRQMYWVDTTGNYLRFEGSGANEAFVCPSVGTFTVVLVEESNDGKRGRATQTINCVSR